MKKYKYINTHSQQKQQPQVW